MSDRLYRRVGAIAIVAVGFFVLAYLSGDSRLKALLTMGGGVACALIVLLWALSRAIRMKRRYGFSALIDAIDNSAAPRLLCDTDGAMCHANGPARALMPEGDGGLLALLHTRIAAPGLVIERLQASALATGTGREQIETRRGILDLHATRVAGNAVLWELDEPEDRATQPGGVPRLPMLTTGRDGTVLFINAAARDFLGARPKSLPEVFASGRIRIGEANDVLTRDGPRQCLVAEFEASAGRREIYLLPADVPAVRGGVVVFDELPVPLLKVAPDGRVLLANRMARELVDREITRDTEMSDLMEGLGRAISDWLAEAAVGHGLHHSEFLRLRRTDREVFIQVTLTRVVEGSDVTLIAVLNDATELKTLEAQFVQSQKMQAIGQLAGGVAHDFNNLLTAISGHCDLLLLRHDQGDPDYADLVQINQNANRAASLVGQLLAFSRKQTLRPEVIDLRDTLADLTHLLNRLVGEKVTLSLYHDPVLDSIRADKRQLEQVLMNLVVNARDAMPDGGEITIRTECLALHEPLTRDRAVVPPGRYVSVKVSDVGRGIAPDKIQKVFEPFYTTKRTGEGTGLGLSTAYGIVKQTGGYIFVDSVLGAGSNFTLLFPMHDVYELPGTIAREPRKTRAKHQGEGVILLVEDEAPVRTFAARALRLSGYTVIEVGSAEAALEALDDDSLNVDLFVTDVVMPGMDGPSWVRRARETRPDVGVVFVSGYAEDSLAENQARIPNSVFLPKPFSLADLTETVQAQLS
ncbi:hybrid sensor histidine kinase/response regulator [Salinihabitans flavidus]|nr:ATP-binding protein [Salinihabitans flavidus]